MQQMLPAETIDKATALHVIASTAVWMCWSVLVVVLYALDMGFSFAELFGLLALTGLAAAGFQLLWFTLGNRALTQSFIRSTTVVLAVIALALGWSFLQPPFSLSLLQLMALLSGLGGAQLYVSQRTLELEPTSMGWELAVTAGVGGVGIVLAQISVPLVVSLPSLFGDANTVRTVISTGNVLGSVRPDQVVSLANVGWFLAGVTVIAVVLGRKRVRAQSSPWTPVHRRHLLRNPHLWVMTVLYVMAFGSFIGFALSFPLVLQFLFGLSRDWQGGEIARILSNDYAPQALTYAWLGPLVGVVARPLGGWFADQYGGAKVTFGCALLLALASLAAAYLTYQAFHSGAPEQYFLLFLLVFFVIFTVSAIASSAIYRSASVLFPPAQLPIALRWLAACAMAGAAYIPLMWGVQSVTATPALALVAFALFYLLCAGLVMLVYLRRHSVYFNP
ncbi:hypothetical protein CWI70_09320 [Pseudidiomarina homiensis]|uniref:MFS transporter n=2 Tax=Pseudidiomarina homiensis TaxID=364198 RepID=A0A432XXT0_9GAMM|nr:hypothetical protein CWI70_09320 [Pseudidiomarina homiensis]